MDVLLCCGCVGRVLVKEVDYSNNRMRSVMGVKV